MSANAAKPFKLELGDSFGFTLADGSKRYCEVEPKVVYWEDYLGHKTLPITKELDLDAIMSDGVTKARTDLVRIDANDFMAHVRFTWTKDGVEWSCDESYTDEYLSDLAPSDTSLLAAMKWVDGFAGREPIDWHEVK